MPTYYLDGPSLALATAVYTDAALTICASDGVYSDGNITRVQTGCVLGSAKFCPSCGSKCDYEYSFSKGVDGIFHNTIDLGNDPGDIGAIIIRFDPTDYPMDLRLYMMVLHTIHLALHSMDIQRLLQDLQIL